jgi:hypothetical protein
MENICTCYIFALITDFQAAGVETETMRKSLIPPIKGGRDVPCFSLSEINGMLDEGHQITSCQDMEEWTNEDMNNYLLDGFDCKTHEEMLAYIATPEWTPPDEGM